MNTCKTCKHWRLAAYGADHEGHCNFKSESELEDALYTGCSGTRNLAWGFQWCNTGNGECIAQISCGADFGCIHHDARGANEPTRS